MRRTSTSLRACAGVKGSASSGLTGVGGVWEAGEGLAADGLRKGEVLLFLSIFHKTI